MTEKSKKALRLFAAMMTLCLLLTGCGNRTEQGSGVQPAEDAKTLPKMPEQLEKTDEGIPVLRVWDTDEEKIEEMDLETYVQGVLAGEMKNDWPMEALKAQAILARTFVLKFCSEKKSKYENADISTDIEEAQAYDATGVNDRIEQAVAETRGLVLSSGGELPYAWFHAHSGGMTALAKEGLNYEKDEPEYTQITQGHESEKAPKDAQEWQASFTMSEAVAAAKKAGAEGLDAITDVQVTKRGDSGRATEITLNGQAVPAAELRIALGSSKMRSTLLTSLRIENGKLVAAGKGYGHGVGMPQWGAYALAEEGKKAEEIVQTYFRSVQVVRLW